MTRPDPPYPDISDILKRKAEGSRDIARRSFGEMAIVSTPASTSRAAAVFTFANVPPMASSAHGEGRPGQGEERPQLA